MKFKLILLILVFSLSTYGQEKNDVWDNGIGHSSWEIALSDEDKGKLLKLWNEIGEDVQNDSHALAGTYVKGGYSAGYFLRWTLNKGFVVIPYFDQNLIGDFGYGTVTVDQNGEVVFEATRQLVGGRGLERMPKRWVPIGQYLVPVESVREFGLFLAGLGIYNEFNGRCCEFYPIFLAQRIDQKHVPFDYPVSARYSRFIRKPINARIVWLGKSKKVKDWSFQGKLYGESLGEVVLVPLRIDAGSAEGVRSNMLLRIVGEPEFYQYVQITKVEGKTASGFVVRDTTDGFEIYHDSKTDTKKPLPPVQIGMRVTTSLANEGGRF
jgi:hypothetical protein